MFTHLSLPILLGAFAITADVIWRTSSCPTRPTSWRGDFGIAIGNILGGIGVQTVVLVALDAFGTRGRRSLTCQAASLSLVLEGGPGRRRAGRRGYGHTPAVRPHRSPAGILRTAIAPSWDEIGKLAAIAALRTILNFFLQREIADEAARRRRGDTPAEHRPAMG